MLRKTHGLWRARTLLPAGQKCDTIMWSKETEKTENDLRAMPYVYLFQLARSQYGFRQYLLTHTENADSLLRFALWRTDVCRALEKQAAEIADALT